MKNLKEIKSGIITGLSFLGTVLIGGIIYATIGSTWTDPQELESSSGSMLTSSNWNKMLANMNSLNDRVNNSAWILDTSGNGILFSTGCDYKFEIYYPIGSNTLSAIHYQVNISSTGGNIGYTTESNYYRIYYNEKNKYYQNGVTWTHDVGKIWKRCN